MDLDTLTPFLRAALNRTPRLSTRPDANVEVHTALCHKDVPYYLLALKSLLRFINDLRLVVHDDGSLTSEDAQLLQEHLPGVHILPRGEMDRTVHGTLAGKTCALLCRESRASFLQVIDYFLAATTERIISLDSDSLFFAYPQELADWLTSGKDLVRYNYELCAGIHLQNRSGAYLFAEEDEFPFPLVEGINGGFVCCPKGIADFDLLEQYLAHIRDTTGLEPGQHVFAQNVFGLYMRNAHSWHLPFPEDQYKVLCHYSAIERKDLFSQHSVFKHYNDQIQRFEPVCGFQQDIQQVLAELMEIG